MIRYFYIFISIISMPLTEISAKTLESYLLMDVENGSILAVSEADRPMMAASTSKLLTATILLDVFDEGYRFETSVLTTGKVEDCVLDGDVVLRGTGDVQLDMDGLLSLALALPKAGICSITGSFYIDDSAFLRQFYINPDQPQNAGYNAGIGPLSLAFNRALLSTRPDGSVMSRPPLSASNPAWKFSGNAKTVSAPIRDTGLFTAEAFRVLAKRAGTDLPPPQRGLPKAQPRKLAHVESDVIRDQVKAMLLYSNNQLAETLGLAGSAHQKGNVQTLKQSADLFAQNLAHLFPDIDWTELQYVNHSGLDPKGRMTARQITRLLIEGFEDHRLIDLLATNGWSGNLQKRLVEPDTNFRVWAKTGSLDFASSIAGYLFTRQNRLMAFAIFLADEEERRAYDLMDKPSAAVKKRARAFLGKSRARQDDLIRSWIADY